MNLLSLCDAEAAVFLCAFPLPSLPVAGGSSVVAGTDVSGTSVAGVLQQVGSRVFVVAALAIIVDV